MSGYEIHADAGRYSIELDDPAVRALPMAPTKLEPELEVGRWLVLAFAVWSTPDRQSIERLLECRETLPEDLRLAVRPFDAHTELTAWCKDVRVRHGSPLWLVLEDGELVAERTGVISSTELRSWLASA